VEPVDSDALLRNNASISSIKTMQG
jgi:hypothetical protein